MKLRRIIIWNLQRNPASKNFL